MSFVTSRVDGHTGVVSLNRPDALNAISGAMADDIAGAMEDVSADGDVWVVVLRAEGSKAFCVGADLKERAGFSLQDFYANRNQVRGMFEAVRSVPQPTIAGIFGFALGGGCELALSCDLIVAAEGTMIGLPETRVGLIPAGGGTQLLTRKVGTSRAKELIFAGKQIDAAAAQRLGLVSDVVARERLDDALLQTARDLCRSSPVALREAKRAIDAAIPLEEGLEAEHDAWTVVIASEDRTEGIAAFNEKRSPEWKNR
ncbi:MAG TPA: enoyl-CoA hydratase-related protein [Actinomycetota bacterium]|nr:enoyl-CoA hydratase-related protein [Actinomycetota bacterium]